MDSEIERLRAISIETKMLDTKYDNHCNMCNHGGDAYPLLIITSECPCRNFSSRRLKGKQICWLGDDQLRVPLCSGQVVCMHCEMELTDTLEKNIEWLAKQLAGK